MDNIKNLGKYAQKGTVPWNKGKGKTCDKFCRTCSIKFRVPLYRKNMALYCSKKCKPGWSKGLKGVNTGEKNGNWKGNMVEYSALHHWVNRVLGKIKECVYCGFEGKIEWASISHKAKRDLNDYIPLCVLCHRNYDKKGGV